MEAINGVNSELIAAVGHLSVIDSSLRKLQDQCQRISHGLANRQTLLDGLNDVLASLTVPAGTVRSVREGGINDEFQAAVLQLDKQMAVASELQSQGVKAASEVLISVGSLLRHACARISDFFSQCLHRLGREMANLGILQQSTLLGRKALFAIMAKYDGGKASLFKKDYIASALTFYHQRYVEASNRLALKGAIPLSPTPLIGDIQQPGALAKMAASLKGAFSASGKTSLAPRNPIAGSTTSIAPSVQQAFEMATIFNGMIDLLADMIQREQAFIREFFAFSDPKDELEMLKGLFGRSATSFSRRIQEKLLVAANLCEVLQIVTKVDEIVGLAEDGSFVRKVFDLYLSFSRTRAELLIIEQIKSLDAALNLVEMAPTISIVTRRFAQFLLDTIGPLGAENVVVRSILKPVIQAMDRFLSHSAALLVNARSQSVYMINNYDYLVTFCESYCRKGVHPVYLSELIQTYEGKLSMVVNGFVTDELKPYFAQLFEFLEQHELGHPLEFPSAVIEDFNKNAAIRLRAIHGSIIQLFSSYRTAIYVVSVMYSQLLTAYGQFVEVHDELVGKQTQTSDSFTPMTVTEVEQIIRQCQNSATGRTPV